LTKKQLYDGIQLCYSKINAILNDVEILCNNSGSESTSVALYTLAVEEYGKYILIKKSLNSKPRNDKTYALNSDIFHNHALKFKMAIEDLPEDCLEFQKFDIDHDVEDVPKSYQIKAQSMRKSLNNLKKSLPEADIGGTVTIVYDFDVRKNLFYVEWNDKKKKWESTLHTEEVKYEYERLHGFIYDENHKAYIKREGNSITVTNYPYREKEIELSEEELYPEKLLLAIENFKNHLKSNSD